MKEPKIIVDIGAYENPHLVTDLSEVEREVKVYFIVSLLTGIFYFIVRWNRDVSIQAYEIAYMIISMLYIGTILYFFRADKESLVFRGVISFISSLFLSLQLLLVSWISLDFTVNFYVYFFTYLAIAIFSLTFYTSYIKYNAADWIRYKHNKKVVMETQKFTVLRMNIYFCSANYLGFILFPDKVRGNILIPVYMLAGSIFLLLPGFEHFIAAIKLKQGTVTAKYIEYNSDSNS